MNIHAGMTGIYGATAASSAPIAPGPQEVIADSGDTVHIGAGSDLAGEIIPADLCTKGSTAPPSPVVPVAMIPGPAGAVLGEELQTLPTAEPSHQNREARDRETPENTSGESFHAELETLLREAGVKTGRFRSAIKIVPPCSTKEEKGQLARALAQMWGACHCGESENSVRDRKAMSGGECMKRDLQHIKSLSHDDREFVAITSLYGDIMEVSNHLECWDEDYPKGLDYALKKQKEDPGRLSFFMRLLRDRTPIRHAIAITNSIPACSSDQEFRQITGTVLHIKSIATKKIYNIGHVYFPEFLAREMRHIRGQVHESKELPAAMSLYADILSIRYDDSVSHDNSRLLHKAFDYALQKKEHDPGRVSCFMELLKTDCVYLDIPGAMAVIDSVPQLKDEKDYRTLGASLRDMASGYLKRGGEYKTGTRRLLGDLQHLKDLAPADLVTNASLYANIVKTCATDYHNQWSEDYSKALDYIGKEKNPSERDTFMGLLKEGKAIPAAIGLMEQTKKEMAAASGSAARADSVLITDDSLQIGGIRYRIKNTQMQ